MNINFYFPKSVYRLFTAFILVNFCGFSGAVAGPGIHGIKTVSTPNEIVNEFTTLTANAITGSFTITVANSTLNANGRFAGPLVGGELVMIIQMQGATINTANANSSLWGTIMAYNNAGKFELMEVANVPNGTTINFTSPTVNAYTASGKVQVIRVPRCTNFIITGSGSLTTQAWNGSTGGVLVVETNNNLNIGGSINVTGKGFRGGIVDSTANSNHIIYASTLKGDGAEKGEGIAGSIASYDLIGGRYGRGAPANGGGGGNSHNAGGGGGSNGDNGFAFNGMGNPDTITNVNWKLAWDLEGGNFHSNVSSGGGRGGYTYSMKAKDPLTTGPGNTGWNGDERYNVGGWGGRPLNNSGNRIFMGGGGGAGDNNNNSGGGGGNGGGIVVLLVGNNLGGGGAINASGDPGINSTANDAAGGGGGGGAVMIYSRGTPSSGVTVNARGGNGGHQARIVNTSGEAEGPGGGGGGGYVTITNPHTLTVNISGGVHGTTNTPALSAFAPNGATMGGSGLGVANPASPYSEVTPLPVSLINFNGKPGKEKITLNWITATEINNNFFTVEKSLDGNEYVQLGTIPGNGTSTSQHIYEFSDLQPIEGINYYRLVQTDYNGMQTRFGPVAVHFGSERKNPEIISFGPNPFLEKFSMHVQNGDEIKSAQFEIVNMIGQIVDRKNLVLETGTNDITISFDHASGIYFMILSGDNFKSQPVKLVAR